MSQEQEQQSTDFLDVPQLLRRSQPIRRAVWMWYALGLMGAMVLVSSVARSQAPSRAGAIEAASSLAMLALLGGSMYVMFSAARAVHAEQQRLQAIEELMLLRRWDQAAGLLEHLMSSPMRTLEGRFQAMMFLASILARYHRFHEAVEMYDRLLETDGLDPASSHGLRLGRAMAILRDDRLYDADRAIVELRRDGTGPSPGLELIELYRDVKTGHPQDAVERFDRTIKDLKRALGCRAADAWGLVAAARLALGDSAGARTHWLAATSLVPPLELVRRYPELSTISQTFQPVPVPQEAA